MTEKIADLTYTILDQVQKFLRENLFFSTFHWSSVFLRKKRLTPLNDKPDKQQQ